MGLLWIIVAGFLALIAIVTLIDLIRHASERSGLAVAGLAVAIIILPLIGSIIYWVTRTTSQDDVEAQRLAEADVRRQAAHRQF